MTIAYRDALDTDRDFIRSSWSASYKQAYAGGMIHEDDWSTCMHKQIDRVMARDGVRTIVAFENTASTFVYGFICGDTRNTESPVIFYTYVKAPYRKAGYARGLFAALGVDPDQKFYFVCKTSVITRLGDKMRRARWEPLIARYPDYKPEERR